MHNVCSVKVWDNHSQTKRHFISNHLLLINMKFSNLSFCPPPWKKYRKKRKTKKRYTTRQHAKLNILFGKTTRFPTRNPPTQKGLLKQCSKQQVYNLEAALFQMWSRQHRPQGGSPPKKHHQQLQEIKTYQLWFGTLSPTNNTMVEGYIQKQQFPWMNDWHGISGRKKAL